MTRRQKDRRRRARGRGCNKGLLALAVVGVLGTLVGLTGVGYVAAVAASAPSLSVLKPRDLGGASRVFASDGEPLGFIQATEFRQIINGDRIPKVMKDATVAIEDERFYAHNGVDLPGVVRAAVANVASQDTVQGGSTITMQLVRSLYITRERTYERKIREAKLAEELENERSKEWILDTYLNSVDFGAVGGQSALGVQAAARMYFNKPAWKLELHEAAMIAGLPQAPDSYSPDRHPDEATRRRNEVLTKMSQLGMVTAAEAEEAKRKGLGLELNGYFTKRREQYFFDYVKDELVREYGSERVRRGGLRVYTTIDLKKQEAARAAIKARLEGVGPAASIVTLDPRDGEIEAMATAADYGTSVFNLAAQGKRQPGSTYKIMTLMAAIREGVNPAAVSYASKPLSIPPPRCGPEPYEPKNYENSYAGSRNLVSATTNSDNSVYMQLALDIGPDKVRQSARDMGITSPLGAFCAETLGGLKHGVSPLEMAAAYATIANGGYRTRPTAIRKVVFPDGRSERPKRFQPKRTRTFEDWVPYEVTKILERNMTEGTGRNAQIGCPAAGKTGTTDTHGDAWFVGYTPRLSTAVWVGYPQGSVPMLFEYHGGRVAGSTFPAEIWGDYMEQAKGNFCGDFAPAKTAPQWVPFRGTYSGTTPSPTPTPGSGSYSPPVQSAPVAPTQPSAPVTPAPAAPAPAAPIPTVPPAPAEPPAAAPVTPPAGGAPADPGGYQSPAGTGGAGV